MYIRMREMREGILEMMVRALLLWFENARWRQRYLCARLASRRGSVALLSNQILVDVRNDTTTGNGCLDQRVQLFIAANGQLQVARSDTLHLEILTGVTGQLQNFGGEVLENGSAVDGSGGTDTTVRGGSVLQMTMDTSDGKLQTSTG